MIATGPANGSDSPARQTYSSNAPPANNPFRPSFNNRTQGRWNNRYRPNNNWQQQQKPQEGYFTELDQPAMTQQDDKPPKEDSNDEEKQDVNLEEATSGKLADHDQGYKHYRKEYGYHTATTIMPAANLTQCRNCAETFPSNNKLHKHLRICQRRQSAAHRTENSYCEHAHHQIICKSRHIQRPCFLIMALRHVGHQGRDTRPDLQHMLRYRMHNVSSRPVILAGSSSPGQNLK